MQDITSITWEIIKKEQTDKKRKERTCKLFLKGKKIKEAT